MERLQKIIAESGFTSRRKAEELINSGKVYVNGVKVTELGTKASFGDLIVVNGVTLNKADYVYFLLNKPRGVISSAADDKKRKTVVDLIDTDKRIYPIGRLDYDTTGLLLLTNDGELTNILTHPKNKVPKKYVAKLNKFMDIADLKKLEKGIDVDGRKCVPTRVKLKKNDAIKNYAIVEITIVEGRNHIVKKIFESMRIDVIKLSRVSYAFLTLDGLKSGEYRQLSIKEIKKLYALKKC